MAMSLEQLQRGEHGEPTHRVLHVSDTHFVSDGELLYDTIDSDRMVERLFEGLLDSDIEPDAVVFTGDLTDGGQLDGYLRLRQLVEPACEALGAELIWVMGNHDSRTAFRAGLWDGSATEDSVDYVVEVNGLRLVVLDSTVPGYHYGEISPQQVQWLSDQLVMPAEHGTLLALHHPPIPSPLDLMKMVELKHQHRLVGALAGTDVRGILAGHLHYSTTSTVPGGIPVSVAAATCYTQDLRAPAGNMYGQLGAQGCNLVDVYPDRVVHTVVPLDRYSSATTSTMASMVQLFEESRPPVKAVAL